jgi:beta-mannosidase
MQSLICNLSLKAYDMHSAKYLEMLDGEKEVTLAAKQNTELGIVSQIQGLTEDSLVVFSATLVSKETGAVLCTNVSWPEPFRYLQWPKNTSVETTISKCESENFENTITVTSNYPIKGLWIEPQYDGTEKETEAEPLWDDNMIDLMPGVKAFLQVNGLRGRGIRTRFLYDWEMKNTLSLYM